MNCVYIYHHLGLGDHIIANGMVRTIAKQYDRTFVFCKPHNFTNVSFMFRDQSRIKMILMNDMEIRSFINTFEDNNYIIAGHGPFWEILNSPNNTKKIDEIFYELAGVPLENKWKEFYVQRDLEKEKEVFHKLGLKEGEKFIFVHDDSDRRVVKEISNKRTIKPSKEFSIFDYIYTIEQAEEIHCINSSFFCLIDCIGIKKEKMYLHEYARRDVNEDSTPVLGSNWIILK